MGIQPDILVCRSDRPLGKEIRQKLALFCNVKPECIIENINMPSLYEIPLALEEEGLAEQTIKRLKLQCKQKDLSDWEEMVEKSKIVNKKVEVALARICLRISGILFLRALQTKLWSIQVMHR